MYYSLVRDSRGQTLSLNFLDGGTETVSEDHPRFNEIYDAALDDSVSEDVIRKMVNVLATVGDHLTGLSERVSITGKNVFFDGDPIRNEIADHILRLVQQGDDKGYKALVNFLEKVQTNPNEHSRESLYNWLQDQDFTITADGDLIAYKGVQVNADGVSESISRGTATVNGTIHEGAIPNPDGAIVEMPRSAVQHDTGVACSTGLHAGSWEYASNFARGRVLTVKINPRDVVSVPTDCEAQKVRVCRYEVLSSVEHKYEGTTWNTVDVDEGEDAEDYEDDNWYDDEEDQDEPYGWDGGDDSYYDEDPDDYDDEEEDEDDPYGLGLDDVDEEEQDAPYSDPYGLLGEDAVQDQEDAGSQDEKPKRSWRDFLLGK
jgi:hypothetical protein